jgi:RNA polymerase sigma-70 factor (TIGR02957 family)
VTVTEFEAARPRLFGLAYRLLGSAQEAEDVVQDAFLRWNNAGTIENPPAWMTKVVTNLSLNRLNSARVRREKYVGPWLPEPVLTTDDPADSVALHDAVSLAMLLMLERLSPTERAVFVLREAFDYSHRDIAEILDISEVNSRQVHRRAGMRIGSAERRFAVDRVEQRELVERFLAAARYGDVAALEELLAANVIGTADSGGKAPAARRPIVGRDRVARYIVGGISKFGVDVELAEVNGAPAILGRLDGTLLGVLVFEIADGQISAIRTVANPDKLRFIDRQLSQKGALPGS